MSGIGIVCCAAGCTAASPRPFCRFHWELVPRRLKSEWHHRDRNAPEKALLARMAAAVEQAQYGERML